MNERPNDEIEARLRAALTRRADQVEPAAVDGSTSVARMAGARESARRRRLLLTAAAVVVVAALAFGSFALLGGDDPDIDVATGPDPTDATDDDDGGEGESGEAAIWPLPSMSVAYDDPLQAAKAFATGFLGMDESVCADGGVTGERGSVLLIAAAEGCQEPNHGGWDGAASTVTVERRVQGWVVLGAESNRLEVAPAAGAVVGADIVVDVTGGPTEATLVAELRPFGSPAGSAPTVDSATVPRGTDGAWHLVLGAADGPTVLLVTDGATVTARIITVDSTSVPPETTTTGPSDDGTTGWPGPTSRHFDAPDAAAEAFIDEVLDFDDPVRTERTVGAQAIDVTFVPRPTATVSTTVTVHDTGTLRGWVVTGVRGSDGVIDSVSRQGDDVAVTGSASAFEATVNVRLLDLAGNVLGETNTMAGGSGVLEPFRAVVHQDVASDGPIVVQVAERDASDLGTYVWATWALVPS